MPRFMILLLAQPEGSNQEPERASFSLDPPDDASTSQFNHLRDGMGISIEDGAHAQAAALTVNCSGHLGHAPSLMLQAGEDGIVFQVAPAPPSGPAVFGPLNMTEVDPDYDPNSVPPPDPQDEDAETPAPPVIPVTVRVPPSEDPAVTVYSVLVLTTAEAQSRGIIT